ncbi:hypothetical protein GCM10009087_03250 [Sphingomonas oligophenolica]|uniref:STAS/SEC14 domain-containing protein n=1 Tax=Sphingomonas oligophenolica TaxID=301154 RepID=A0ABU9Y0N6_9SPHN
MRKPEIIASPDGFAIVTAKGTDDVSLDEVRAIIAYKLDELTTDLVCCDIVTGAGDGEQIRTIHEELSGFDAAMAKFENLPGFNREWRDAVIDPTFATNRTLIYSRTFDT